MTVDALHPAEPRPIPFLDHEEVPERWSELPADPTPPAEPRAETAEARDEDPAARSAWLGEMLSSEGGWTAIARRSLIGLALCAAFGLAVGARAGGTAPFASAAGVAVAPAVVFALGIPALYIVLAVFDAPIEARQLAGCASRGVASLGLALAGLAPLSMLYVVTAGDDLWAALTALAALVAAGVMALGQFMGAVRERLDRLSFEVRAPMSFAAGVFCLLVTIAACRTWFGLLPILGGGR